MRSRGAIDVGHVAGSGAEVVVGVAGLAARDALGHVRRHPPKLVAGVGEGRPYKGYAATITFDLDAEILHGEVVGLRDVITFQATSVEDLKQEFRTSVDDYLAWCEELGQEPERVYSGKYLVRMEPALHRDLAIAADRAGTSINAYVVACIAESLNVRRADGLLVGPDVSSDAA